MTEETFWADTTPLHSHPGAEEAFYVVSGEVEAWVDGTVSTARHGTFLVVPRGVPHGLRRLSDEPVQLLTLISPPGFERLFDAVAEQGEEELLSDPQRLVELAARFGTDVHGDYPA